MTNTGSDIAPSAFAWQHWYYQNNVWNLFIVRFQNDVIYVILVYLWLTLYRFHIMFWCFHCWLGTCKYQLMELRLRDYCFETKFYKKSFQRKIQCFFFTIYYVLNPFHATDLFWYPLKTSENQTFSNVSRGYQKRSVARNGLIKRC